MKIPAYWARETAKDSDADGRTAEFTCWGWSTESQEAARESALARAKRVLQGYLSGRQLGRYPYGNGVLREEVLETFTDAEGAVTAAVTRNSSGALVLSTAHVMFIDVDFPFATAGQRLKYLFARLFGRPAIAPGQKRESEAVAQLEQFLAEQPDWNFHIYRTFAGVRAIATHALFDPAAEETLSVLRSLGTDPLYLRLCKTQESFRARLTPKPFRCGHHSNSIPWPRDGADAESRFRQWHADYSSRSSRFATCRFVRSLGNGRIHPEIEAILEIHDKSTRCREPLPLA